MKWYAILFLFIGVSTSSVPQPTWEKMIRGKKLIANCSSIFIFDENILSRLNTKGELLYEFNSSKYGNISSVDCQNSLKHLVFYEDLQQFILLDNTLSLLDGPFYISDWGVSQTQVISLASDGNAIWVYDEFANKISKINFSGTSLLDINLNTKEFSPSERVQSIYEKRDKLIICTNELIHVFLNVGVPVKTLPYLPEEELQTVSCDNILRITKDSIHIHDADLDKIHSLKLPIDDAQWTTCETSLITFRKDTLSSYSTSSLR